MRRSQNSCWIWLSAVDSEGGAGDVEAARRGLGSRGGGSAAGIGRQRRRRQRGIGDTTPWLRVEAQRRTGSGGGVCRMGIKRCVRKLVLYFSFLPTTCGVRDG